MSQPGSPATQNPQSGTSRIDPNQIPRPLPGATSIEFETRVNGQANLPPVCGHIHCRILVVAFEYVFSVPW